MPLYDDTVHYSVKEVSKILGIGEQTLRYYDRIGLMEPFYRDPESRYRFYTINQFYLLEQFKYAKQLGLSVEEYRDLALTADEMQRHDVRRLEGLLDRLLRKNEDDLARAQRNIADLSDMKSRLALLRDNSIDGAPFTEKMPVRCVYVIDHNPADPFEKTSVRMRSSRTKYGEHLTEHYGLLLSLDAAREGRIAYEKQYVVLDGFFEESDEIMHLPAGDYTCFLYHAFRPEEQMGSLAASLGDATPRFPYVVADEVNFHEKVNEIVHAVRILPE